MLRFSRPEEIATLLLLLRGTHNISRDGRREILVTLGSAFTFFLATIAVMVQDGRLVHAPHGIAVILVFVLGSTILLWVIILFVQQRFIFAEDMICVQRPLGLGSWSITPEAIREIQYRYDDGASRLIFVLINGTRKGIHGMEHVHACIEQMLQIQHTMNSAS